MMYLVCIGSFITMRCKLKEIWDPKFTKIKKCRVGEKRLLPGKQ